MSNPNLRPELEEAGSYERYRDREGSLLEAGGTLSPRLSMALRWWRAVLFHGPPREMTSGVRRTLFEGWTDAALEPAGLGGVLSPSGMLSGLYFGTPLGDRLAAWMPPPTLQRQIIFQLELMAPVIFIIRFAKAIKGHALRLWIDNEGAKCALRTGYSRNPWGARIAAQFWLEVTRLNVAVSIERVASKDNVADGPSRDRYDLVHRLG